MTAANKIKVIAERAEPLPVIAAENKTPGRRVGTGTSGKVEQHNTEWLICALTSWRALFICRCVRATIKVMHELISLPFYSNISSTGLTTGR